MPSPENPFDPRPPLQTERPSKRANTRLGTVGTEIRRRLTHGEGQLRTLPMHSAALDQKQSTSEATEIVRALKERVHLFDDAKETVDLLKDAPYRGLSRAPEEQLVTAFSQAGLDSTELLDTFQLQCDEHPSDEKVMNMGYVYLAANQPVKAYHCAAQLGTHSFRQAILSQAFLTYQLDHPDAPAQVTLEEIVTLYQEILADTYTDESTLRLFIEPLNDLAALAVRSNVSIKSLLNAYHHRWETTVIHRFSEDSITLVKNRIAAGDAQKAKFYIDAHNGLDQLEARLTFHESNLASQETRHTFLSTSIRDLKNLRSDIAPTCQRLIDICLTMAQPQQYLEQIEQQIEEDEEAQDAKNTCYVDTVLSELIRGYQLLQLPDHAWACWQKLDVAMTEFTARRSDLERYGLTTSIVDTYAIYARAQGYRGLDRHATIQSCLDCILTPSGELRQTPTIEYEITQLLPAVDMMIEAEVDPSDLLRTLKTALLELLKKDAHWTFTHLSKILTREIAVAQLKSRQILERAQALRDKTALGIV